MKELTVLAKSNEELISSISDMVNILLKDFSSIMVENQHFNEEIKKYQATIKYN